MSNEIQHSNRHGALSEGRLQQFESEIGARLPDDYRAFLLAHNGGEPSRTALVVEMDGDEVELPFAGFYALHDGPSDTGTPDGMLSFPLQAARRDFQSEEPDASAIPIGQDWAGNYVCIELRGESRGAISVWEHEEQRFYSAAPDVATFLDALR